MQRSLNEYVFGFEELENNLHPALLRRLTDYIDTLSEKENFIYFMTTHSNVLIDQYSKKNDSQIIHVTQKDGQSYCRTLENFSHSTYVLDDLEVKASDLLQANGVIWVEGPTDVIYIKKWLDIYVKENNLELISQGRDFEFHMFGGTLLDSISMMISGSDEEEELKKIVSMFSFSRNAFVIIDSDAVRNDDGKIIDKSKFKNAKKHIQNQFLELSKEINNLGLWFKEGDTNITTIEDYLDDDSKRLIKNNKSWSKKVAAQKVTATWDSKKISEFPHNLEKEIKSLYESIRSWNS